jgi:hypothetical protein
LRHLIGTARTLLGALRAIDPMQQNVRVLRLLLEEVEGGFENCVLPPVVHAHVQIGPRALTGLQLLHAVRLDGDGSSAESWQATLRAGLQVDTLIVERLTSTRYRVASATLQEAPIQKAPEKGSDEVWRPNHLFTKYELMPE